MIQDTVERCERDLVGMLARDFLRSPNQKTKLYESDAELIELPGTNCTLAVTSDSISEEIESGLYTDPYMIGWMTVVANASDLAAVGAGQVGMLINETLPKNAVEDFIQALQHGIADASRALELPILGGDTNRGNTLHMSATAIGTVRSDRLLTRVGCKPGDLLFTSGRLGIGNCFAAAPFGFSDEGIAFMPLARLAEGQLLLRFAGCCMDTSDGFLSTLDELKILNGCGFRITARLDSYLTPQAYTIAPELLRPWMTLAGPHGEYELVFTIPQQKRRDFLAAAREIVWAPLLLGEVCEGNDILLQIDDKCVTIDTSEIRNFVYDSSESISEFIRTLWQIEERLQ